MSVIYRSKVYTVTHFCNELAKWTHTHTHKIKACLITLFISNNDKFLRHTYIFKPIYFPSLKINGRIIYSQMKLHHIVPKYKC